MGVGATLVTLIGILGAVIVSCAWINNHYELKKEREKIAAEKEKREFMEATRCFPSAGDETAVMPRL
jgi:hypothetical protein